METTNLSNLLNSNEVTKSISEIANSARAVATLQRVSPLKLQVFLDAFTRSWLVRPVRAHTKNITDDKEERRKKVQSPDLVYLKGLKNIEGMMVALNLVRLIY